MKKEILTIEKCKLDLPRPPIPIISWVLMGIPCLMLLAGTIISCFIPKPQRYIGVSVFGGLFVALVIGCIVEAVGRYRESCRIRDARIRIVEDVLVNTVDHFYFKVATKRDSGGAHMLEFSRYGRFYISRKNDGRRYGDPRSDYYKWSKNYTMSPLGIYNTSLPGDTFYLAIYADDPEQKPIMVYNAKFFTYDEYKFNEES